MQTQTDHATASPRKVSKSGARLPRSSVLRSSAVLIALVTLAAAALRLWHLDQLPPGLWYDEAVNGVDIRMVLSGHGLPIYFAANNGREPLFIYLQALSTLLLGPTPFALRVVAAISGILTVPAIYWCGRVIFRIQPETPDAAGDTALLERWVPLLAAAAIAVCYWHLSLSRLGLRAVLLPLTSTLAIGFFWKGWTGGRRRDYALAGVFLAAALYSYLAARLLPFVLVVFVAIEAGIAVYSRHRRPEISSAGRRWRSSVAGFALLAAVTAILLVPLAVAIWGAPGAVDRSGQVSILSGASLWSGEGLRRIGSNLFATLRAFYDRGDLNLRHNLPGRPATDTLLAVLFTLGWLIALWRIRAPRYRLLLIWFGVMLLPTVLSVEAPHSLRGSGALPPFALFCGLGAATLVSALPRTQWRKIAAPMLVLVVLVFSGGQTARDYFIRWAQSEGLGSTFSVQEQVAAEMAAGLLASGSADSSALISDRLFKQPQMVYALGVLPQTPLGASLPMTQTEGVRFILEDGFDARQPLFLLSRDNAGAKATPIQSLSVAEASVLRGEFEQSGVATPLSRPEQQASRAAVHEGSLPAGLLLRTRSIPYPLAVTFSNGVQLLGYDVEPAPPQPNTQSPQVRLTLFWRSGNDRQYPVDEWVFVNLANETGVWRSENHPLPESYLLPWRQVGREMQDMRLVPVPEEMPPGKAFFEVGIYQPDLADPKRAGPRVGIVDGEGRVVADQVNLGASTVRSDPPQADLTGLRPLVVTFDERISLLGWAATSDSGDPERLRVDLAWRANRRSTTDYAAFVHLIDGSDQILAQSDQPPGGEENPTTKWVPGETVRTTVYLNLDRKLDPASLRLRVGLYEPVSGKQLPLTSDHSKTRETFLLLPVAQER